MKKHFNHLIKKIKFDFLSKSKLSIQFTNLKKKYTVSIFHPQITKLKEFINRNIKRFNFFKKNVESDKSGTDLTVIYYLEHILTLISINKSKGLNTIKGTVEIPIPGFLIGEDNIENSKEFAQIILDMLNILSSQSNPILLILPSSLFNTISLKTKSNQKQPSDLVIKNKTPFLPTETLTDISCFKNKENSYHRVVFSNKKIIDSWINCLKIINLPIVSLTFPILHYYDEVKSICKEKKFALLDIELNSIQVIMTDKYDAITSYKLPYGSSLYTKSSEGKSINQFFDRLKMSIKMIESKNNYETSKNIFVFGQGLDNLLYDTNFEIPLPFYKAKDLQVIKYNEFDKGIIKDSSIINKSIDSKIFISNLILNSIK